MHNYSNNCLPRPFLSLLFLTVLLTFGSNIVGQDKENLNSDTNQPTQSETPEPVKTPVPAGDVIAESEVTLGELDKIIGGLKPSPGILVIESELPNLRKEFDLRISESSKLLSARPSLELLRTLEQDWQSFSKDIPVWNRELKARIDQLDTYLKQLRNLRALWDKTLNSLTDRTAQLENKAGSVNETPETGAVLSADVPIAIVRKVRSTMTRIEKTQKDVERRRSQLLILQSLVNKEESRINETLKSISEVRQEALSHLFVKDSPALWDAKSRRDSVTGLISEAGDSFRIQLASLSEYASRRSDRFILHGLIFLLVSIGLFWAKIRLRPMVENEPELAPAYSVFKLPLVGALIVTIMLGGRLYDQAPRLLLAILGGATLIPGIIYLRRILEKPLFPILNALMLLYFLDQLRYVTATLPLLSRIIFLTEMAGAIIFLVWFLRSKGGRLQIEAKNQSIFIVIRKLIPLLLVLFGAALIANTLGYVGLSKLIGGSVLGSLYIGLILYTAVQISKSLLIFVLRAPLLSKSGMVRNHSETVKRKVFRLLKWIGFVLWGLFTLNLFSLRETLFEFLRSWLTANLEIGSIEISLLDVMIFAATVWAAFAISRVVRFFLDEDVYPRVNLAGGVPYAISTVLHYTLLLIGFVVAIAALGIDSTKFAILAGAFGVGIGFGMQNIVNNFVSGLILLFERPVKINDFVQIGTHQGDLKKIGLRASVLRTLDGSEVIVPNGQLISEEVTNWTFSDPQRRLEIDVGVAYGTDPHEVIKLLTDVVAENKDVLTEPPPRTIFVGFGDNSLNFQVRAWTTSADRWVVVRSDLSLRIHDTLKEASIEIPFPQRDLHLKSMDPQVKDALKK